MLPIGDVRVTRRREREDLGDIDELGASLLKFGQLVPIIVDESNELIDGFRRFTACQGNGAADILVIQRRDVDEALAKELELETNFRRKDMTWRERTKGLTELDRLRRTKDPNWTQGQTAIVAGGLTQQRDVSQAIKMEKMIEMFPELAEAKSLHQAQAIAKAKIDSVKRIITVQNQPEVFASVESRLELGDSVEVIKTIPSETFNAIITDPPFGINYESRTSGSVTSDTSAYQDDKASYERLLTMAPDMYRVLKPDGWLVWFLGISWYDRVKVAFREAGFTVDEIPIIWDRSEGRTFTSRPDRWFGRAYDIALHCIKGSPRIALPNTHNIIRVAPVPSDERELLVERPIELYEELINRLTIRGEYVADFFCGSGSCPAAAARTHRQWYAVERDPARRARAVAKIQANTPS